MQTFTNRTWSGTVVLWPHYFKLLPLIKCSLVMDPVASTQTFLGLHQRLVRLLRRVAALLELPAARPTPALVVELCTTNTLNDCTFDSI